TGMGATYVSTTETPVKELVKKSGPPDIIIECTGHSGVVFTGMEVLGKNGVLVLTSITGGQAHVTIPADKVNLDFVLGNKGRVGTVTANREYWERGVKSRPTAELEYPGLVGRILTHKVQGVENYQELMRLLVEVKSALKVYCEIAPLP